MHITFEQLRKIYHTIKSLIHKKNVRAKNLRSGRAFATRDRLQKNVVKFSNNSGIR